MSLYLIALALILCGTAEAQDKTIRITGVEDHIRDSTEPSFSTPLHSKRVTGVIDGKEYRLEEAAMLAYKFEVGKDYEVRKLSDNRISLWVERRGKRDHEDLTIKSVQEK